MKLFYRLSSLAALALAFSANASIPTGYYNSLNGKSDATLKTAVHDISIKFIYPENQSGYNSTYSNLPSQFRKTDVYPESNRWWDMYSDIPLYTNSFNGLNREHSFPKSWWGGNTDVPAYIDLNHLYPGEAAANMAKSNYPLGTVNKSYTVKFDNGVSTVGYPVTGQGGGASFVFEPADEYKGDFARTYFYMATTYQDFTWKYTYMVSQNTYPTLTSWAVNLLLKWSREDPVSEKEINRNEEVYKIQNNRNPFIDYPELAEYIWGNKKGQIFNTNSSSTTPDSDPILITPVQDMSLDFGEVALGQSITARLLFQGNNLNAPINVQIYRDNSEMFFVDNGKATTIAANLANSEDGYWLPVVYTPTEIGEHTSRLLISGGGVSASRGVALIAKCLPVPELSACTATAPTDITDNSYVANWTVPQDEVVDYFIVTRTMYKNGVATSEELQAETNELLIEDFDLYDSESYSVQSVRLGYRSPMSNTVYVSRSGVQGVTVDTPFAILNLDGAVRFICSTPHTGVRIFDTTGRCIKYIDSVDNNTDILLPQGIYVITSDQCHRPVKAIVR
jgi:endonuclease I